MQHTCEEFHARMVYLHKEALVAFVLFDLATFIISRFFKQGKTRGKVYLAGFTILAIIAIALLYVMSSLAGLR